MGLGSRDIILIGAGYALASGLSRECSSKSCKKGRETSGEHVLGI